VIYGLSLKNVKSKFNVEVKSRISRISLGVVHSELWRSGYHAMKDKDPANEKIAINQMFWFVKIVSRPFNYLNQRVSNTC